jgi:hypothetical protein
MSAKELMFFLPKSLNSHQMLNSLVKELGLEEVDISGNSSLKYQCLVRKGEGRSIL